jgi:hypothetical protein
MHSTTSNDRTITLASFFPVKPTHGVPTAYDKRYHRGENAPGSEPRSLRYDLAIQPLMNIHEQLD